MEMSSRVAKRSDWKSRSDSEVRRAAIRSGPSREMAWRELIRRHGPRVVRAIEGVLLRIGRRPDRSVVDDLVESTWLRVTRQSCKKLRDWDPHGGASLGTHLAIIGMGEALTWCRYKAAHREVIMDFQKQRSSVDRADGNPTPDQTAWLKEAEKLVQDWQESLAPLERETLRLRRKGMGQIAIGRVLNRSQQFVSKTLIGLKKGLDQLVRG